MEQLTNHFGTNPGISRRAFSLGLGGWLTSQLSYIPGLAMLDRDAVEDQIAAARALLETDSASGGSELNDRAELMTDAKVAWSYFENWNVFRRPIIPGTAYLEDGKRRGYPLLTMWDVASLINACVSARLLGLISDAELLAKGRQIVIVLRRSTARFGNVLLPGIEISATSMQARPAGFDAADVGRLLISLKLLDNLTIKKLAIDQLIGHWGFSRVIQGGAVRSIAGNRLQPFDSNSYVRYYVQGYRLWGYDIPDPFVGALPQLTSGSGPEFFVAAAGIGRFATEPLVTELIELGDNSETRFLADMLYAAQIERFQSSGIPTCVSEGILDQTPWFSYQACQFNPPGAHQWVIDTGREEHSAIVKSKGDSLRTISTKGSFLWRAARPGAYSKMLVDLARRKARDSKLAFLSNIYETSQEPTNCSDINANGLILESIAYILGGRRPLLEISAGGTTG